MTTKTSRELGYDVKYLKRFPFRRVCRCKLITEHANFPNNKRWSEPAREENLNPFNNPGDSHDINFGTDSMIDFFIGEKLSVAERKLVE